ncbi:MAG: GAF domain-containing protein, partial [Deltaproteobacteria bacterium]|nr:GAF domain-containing protein [Deltaproteobacteria bacterium]
MESKGKNRQGSDVLKKANEELQARIKELALINEFSQLIVSTLEMPKLYNILDHFLGEKLGFNEFALLLREKEEEVVVQVARGFADTSRVRGMVFKSGEGLTGVVFQTRRPCYITDTRQESRYLYYKGEKKEDGSFLSIPLLFKGQVVGILNFTRAGVDSFSAQEIQFLNTIAVQIAIALMN